ncbi:MAG: leucine-rich repeat domain-containing protein [Eubacterium sp.]
MKRFSKKLLSVLLALVLATGSLAGIVAYADDLVAINETNFPDVTFRRVISENYDDNGDGYLNADERNVTYMSVTGMIDEETESIKNLKGIENFANLQILRCGGIGLEKLDVMVLLNLKSLSCQGNNLTELSLEFNPMLELLNCSDNNLSSMSFSGNVKLTMLHCYANNLSEIDVTQLTNLEDFRCDQNNIKSLDLTKNTKLTTLNCSQNMLTSLDLSQNTLLGEVTDYMIGEQTITLPATIQENAIIVNFPNSGLNEDNFVSCSLDIYDDGSGFDYSKFTAYDVSEIENGIDYSCYPLLETSENMGVHIDVTRDFYQVDFYTADDLSERIGKSLVSSGGTATAPEITELPQCKAIDYWSESIEDVTADMSVYPIWKDNHTYAITAFDGDMVTVSCSVCENSYTVSFKTLINAKSGDSNYDSVVDVTGDGYINAKDYAKLSKMF